MPIPVDKNALLDLNPILEDDLKKVLFCRAASDGSFSKDFYSAIVDVIANDSNSSNPQIKNSYILKHEFESDKSYNRRVAFGLDPEYCPDIIDKYMGILARVPKLVSPDNDFVNNMDGQGCDLNAFAGKVFAELFPAGSCTIMVDGFTNEAGDVIPYCDIIKRESVLDWEWAEPNNDGAQYKWIKYKRYSYSYDGIKRVKAKQIVVVDSEAYQVFEIKDKDWVKVEELPNPLGYVPFFTIYTPEWEPIITNPAKVQFNEMNMKSEVRHSLSIQCLQFLQLPMSAAKSFKVGSANSIIALPDEHTGPTASFISPNSTTYDPHFKMMTEDRSAMRESIWAANKKTNQAESGESKAFDWLNVEIILQFASENISNLLGRCLTIMTEIDGRRQEIAVSIPIDNAIKKDAIQTLETYIKIKLIGLGDEGNALIRERALDLLGDIPPERKELILEQIRELANEESIGLFEPMAQNEDEDDE